MKVGEGEGWKRRTERTPKEESEKRAREYKKEINDERGTGREDGGWVCVRAEQEIQRDKNESEYAGSLRKRRF